MQAADRENPEGSNETSDSSPEESNDESSKNIGKDRAAAQAIPDKRVGTAVLCAIVMSSRHAVGQSSAQWISAHRAGQLCPADTWRRQEERQRGDQWDAQGCRCSGEVYQRGQEEQRHTTSRGHG